MKKIVAILGVVALAGTFGVSQSYARSLNTNTATINSAEMGLQTDAAGGDFDTVSKLIAHFTQDATNNVLDGYAPTGAPGALTSNPDGCTIRDGLAGYSNIDNGLMSAAAVANNCGYKSADPQTAGPDTTLTGGNTASGLITSQVSFSLDIGQQDAMRTVGGSEAFDYLNINGTVQFEMVPSAAGGVIQVFRTEFTQDLDEYTLEGTAGLDDVYIAGATSFIYDFDNDTMATDCAITPVNCHFNASDASDVANWTNTATAGIKTTQGFVQAMNVGSDNRVLVPTADTSYGPPDGITTMYPIYGVGDIFAMDANLTPTGCETTPTLGCTTVMNATPMTLNSGNASTNAGIVDMVPPGF